MTDFYQHYSRAAGGTADLFSLQTVEYTADSLALLQHYFAFLAEQVDKQRAWIVNEPDNHLLDADNHISKKLLDLENGLKQFSLTLQNKRQAIANGQSEASLVSAYDRVAQQLDRLLAGNQGLRVAIMGHEADLEEGVSPYVENEELLRSRDN